MFRFFDITLSVIGLICFFPLILILTLINFFYTYSPFYEQERLGRNKKLFKLIKFRTMHKGTISVATHLADPSAITPLGRILRRTKFDEIPQLWNVLKGDMSLVGPRPGLSNQIELIEARENHKVFDVRPGITGLAQTSGVDMSTPELLAETDSYMITKMSLSKYFKYIFLTVLGRGQGDSVKKKL